MPFDPAETRRRLQQFRAVLEKPLGDEGVAAIRQHLKDSDREYSRVPPQCFEVSNMDSGQAVRCARQQLIDWWNTREEPTGEPQLFIRLEEWWRLVLVGDEHYLLASQKAEVLARLAEIDGMLVRLSAGPTAERLSETEQQIIGQVKTKSDIGPNIANKLGKMFNSHFKGVLAKLVKRGYLSNNLDPWSDGKGYKATRKGLDAVRALRRKSG